jgi:hypothetical protein
MSKYTVKILDVTHDGDILKGVIGLWRVYAKTLGFFPEGAFNEHAIKKQIVVALNDSRKVLGYLLFRTSKQKVSITHLCIDKSCRGVGLSRTLVDYLKKETLGLKGIGLYCRRDYEVNTLWPKFGFIPITEKTGRGKDKSVLTFWWLDYNSPNLFSQLIDVDEKIEIIADANIFFDLDEENEKQESQETKFIRK